MQHNVKFAIFTYAFFSILSFNVHWQRMVRNYVIRIAFGDVNFKMVNTPVNEQSFIAEKFLRQGVP